jgi:hypothetical protein
MNLWSIETRISVELIIRWVELFAARDRCIECACTRRWSYDERGIDLFPVSAYADIKICDLTSRMTGWLCKILILSTHTPSMEICHHPLAPDTLLHFQSSSTSKSFFNSVSLLRFISPCVNLVLASFDCSPTWSNVAAAMPPMVNMPSLPLTNSIDQIGALMALLSNSCGINDFGCV